MTDDVYKFQGQTFKPSLLPRFSCNFIQAYESRSKISSETWISVFEKETEHHKTFSEFDLDVRKAQAYIADVAKDSAIICTIGFNSYLHAVFITATLLCQKTLFLLNPNENHDFYLKQIEQLDKESFTFYDPLLNISIENSRPFLLQETVKLSSPPVCDNIWRTDFIYVNTSGSTGQSKIVRQSEAAVMSNVAALSEVHQLNHKSSIATCLPLFHVNALEFSFLCSLLNSSRLLLFDETFLSQVPKKIQHYGAEIISLTPHILRVFAQTPNLISKYFAEIKYFVSAASALSSELANEIWRQGNKKIIQGYGLSEAVNFSCLVPPRISDTDYRILVLESKIPSIGSPLWGNEVEILDDNSVQLGPDQSGEIAIHGFTIMQSYIGKAAPTQFLRTGDVGFYKILNNQRYFFIQGRKKDVAKRLGESIPLRDLDDQILNLGYQFDLVTIAFPHEKNGEEIGLICAHEPLSKEQAHQFETQLLKIPFYKRPKVVLFRPGISLRTSSGKPQRWKQIQEFRLYYSRSFSNLKVCVE